MHSCASAGILFFWHCILWAEGKSIFWGDSRQPSNCIALSDQLLTVTVSTHVVCSLLCAARRCEAFEFDNGVCTVSKVTLPGSLTATFRTPVPTNTSTEVARGKPVTAVPNYMTLTKEFAVDGRNDTRYHSDATGAYKTPWLLVNLVGAMLVQKVRLLPYVGVMPGRINNYQILLGNDVPPTAMDFSQYDLVGAIPGPVPLGEKWYEFDVSPPRCSRYVAVYKNVATTDYIMEISEMEVFVLN